MSDFYSGRVELSERIAELHSAFSLFHGAILSGGLHRVSRTAAEFMGDALSSVVRSDPDTGTISLDRAWFEVKRAWDTRVTILIAEADPDWKASVNCRQLLELQKTVRKNRDLGDMAPWRRDVEW